MPAESLTTGYYGKVPTHGDFVSRGLPRNFIDPWDDWLQEAIMSSHQQLGENWLNYYLTSPIYRFVLSPCICGDSGWRGILMPSVDRIGRYYPMTISQMIQQPSNPFTTLQEHDQWFTQIEKIALSCLQDDFCLDNFNQNLSQLATEPADTPIPIEQRPEKIEAQSLPCTWQQPTESIASIQALLPSILDNVLKEQCFAYSVWWTQGSQQVEPSLLICAGLPPFAGIAAMFDGDWQQWGWGGNRYPLPPQ
jgi:type VI secretion system protein ImpM